MNSKSTDAPARTAGDFIRSILAAATAMIGAAFLILIFAACWGIMFGLFASTHIGSR